MLIDIYCASSIKDNGKVTQLSGCAIIMTLHDGDVKKIRKFGYPLGASPLALANIQAARLALASILPVFRGSSTVVLHLPNNPTAKWLEKGADGKYENNPKSNAQAIEEMRRWSSYYDDLKFYVDKSSEFMDEVRELARDVVENQEGFDTHTMDMKDVAEVS